MISKVIPGDIILPHFVQATIIRGEIGVYSDSKLCLKNSCNGDSSFLIF